VRINEEELERKVADPVYKTEINDRRGSAALITRHRSIHKSWHLISSTRGGRSVSTLRLRSFLFVSFYGAGVEPSPLLLRSLMGLLYQPWMIDGHVCRDISGINEWKGKLKYSEETCLGAALTTANPT
jgi:hypothetical protein